MSLPVNALTLQLLEWLAAAPRSYADTMDAWRSTCPRMTIWEDALKDGLVVYEAATSKMVRLTPRGDALLRRQTQPALRDAAE